MAYTVPADGHLILNFSGIIGPQLSINNLALSTEQAHYSRTAWMVNAVLIHPRSAAATLPPQARNSLAFHMALASNLVTDWAVVGPFNDTTSTGLYRSVSLADGSDRNLSHAHLGKDSSTAVHWRRVRGAGPVAVASATDNDGQGSASVLQTSIFCPSPTPAVISFSTVGTGTMRMWSATGASLFNATDAVYAGLFDSEISVNTTILAGWSDLQVKTLSHFSTALAWEAQAAVWFTNTSSGCRIDACGPYGNAPMCKTRARLKTTDEDATAKEQQHPDRVKAIEDLKATLHTLPVEEASRRFDKLWLEHTLSAPPQRQDKIDHFVV